MNNYPLSYRNNLGSQVFSHLEKLIHLNISIPNQSSQLKKPSNQPTKRFWMIQTRKGSKRVVRAVGFTFKNHDYFQIKNEIFFLRVLRHLSDKIDSRINFSKILRVEEHPHMVRFSREYIVGIPLNIFNVSTQLITLSLCLQSFQDMSQVLSDRERQRLPQKTAFSTLIEFPFYLLIACLKHPRNLSDYLHLGFIFYWRSFVRIFRSETFVISHRDLHSQNILINKKRINIIDTEICVLAEPETDLVLIARNYSLIIPSDQMISFVRSRLKTHDQISRFVTLGIFYAIQLLSMQPKSETLYAESQTFLAQLLKEYLPAFNHQ